MNMDKTSADAPVHPAPDAPVRPAPEAAAGPAATQAPGFGPAPVAPAGYGVPVVPVHAPGYAVYVAQTVPKELRVGAGARFGAYLLNLLLMVVTLGIGWLVWAMVTWSTDAANPGQKILGLTIVKKDTGARLTWGDMFVRNFLLGGLVLSFLSGITLSILAWVNLFKVCGSEKQSLVDSMADTVVVRRTV
ncbi:RDD family protein [Streptomyces sp. NPDC015532]|uniref:RDD family protein n=1 Tax=Streptomyces sp. NPDC015532 TaxID=3364960 RepID=UPI0036FE5BD2